MPTSVTGLLILVFTIFPGLVGNKIYNALVGISWREKEMYSILRLLGFSIVGVMIYSIIGSSFNFYPPIHLFPSTYANISPEYNKLRSIAYPFVGHLIFGSLAGLLGAWGAIILAKFSSSTPYPGAWDDFMRNCVPNHWVVVGLCSGEVYAGKVKSVAISVEKDDRDVVLEEPCQYNENDKDYVGIGYQYMYVPANNLFSIGVIHDPAYDKRTIAVGEKLLGGNDERKAPPFPSQAKSATEDPS